MQLARAANVPIARTMAARLCSLHVCALTIILPSMRCTLVTECTQRGVAHCELLKSLEACVFLRENFVKNKFFFPPFFLFPWCTFHDLLPLANVFVLRIIHISISLEYSLVKGRITSRVFDAFHIKLARAFRRCATFALKGDSASRSLVKRRISFRGIPRVVPAFLWFTVHLIERLSALAVDNARRDRRR